MEYRLALDTLPNAVYERINELTFVRNKMEQLQQHGFKTSFFTKAFPDSINEFHLIQVVTIDTFKMRPLFNFHYYVPSDSLLYMDTFLDSLILIEHR